MFVASGSADEALAALPDAQLMTAFAATLTRTSHQLDDAERIALLTALEDLKAAACAAQARIAVDLAASQEQAQTDAGVPAVRRGAGIGAQIALARRESPHRGGRLLGLAKALVHEMPHTLAALQTGLVNEWRATLIVRETACLSREDRTSIDTHLWTDPTRTARLGDRALAAKVRAEAYRADPHAVTARAARATAERSVTLRPAPDTMTYLTALLPVAQGVAAYAALTRAADTTRATGGESRSRGQVMADTLVERLTGQQRADDVRVRVNLVMTDASLLAGDPAPAVVPGYGPIPAGIARQLATRAIDLTELRRLYTRPSDGRLVALESRARRFPRGLAEFIDLRDQTCRTPWCDAPIRHHDHITADTAGGPTRAVNGQGLCEACNYAKQALGWRARPGLHGAVHTTTPTGHQYTSPEPQPPGRPPPRPVAPVLDLSWGAPHLHHAAA